MLNLDCHVYLPAGLLTRLELTTTLLRLDSGSDGESLPGVAGAGQSNLSTGVAALIQDQMVSSPLSPVVRSFSPDQDFIEMDFDPGSDSEEGGSEDSGQGVEGEEEVEVEREDEAGALGDDVEDERDSSVSPDLVMEAVPSPPSNNNVTDKERPQECSSCQPKSPAHPSSAPVLSPSEEVTLVMPRSRSLNSSLGAAAGECLTGQGRTHNLSICGSRLKQREALMFGGEGEARDQQESQQVYHEPPGLHEMDDLMSALYRLTLPDTPIPLKVKPAANRVMIWSEKEAVRKQVRHSNPQTQQRFNVVYLDQSGSQHLLVWSHCPCQRCAGAGA